jgi:hypothetical protein
MSILPGENEIKMITHKSKRIKSGQNPITSQPQTHSWSHSRQRIPQIRPVPPTHEDNIPNTLRCKIPSHQTSRENKREKVSIITSANTVVEPDTVMIAVLDAGVADAAVGGTGGTPYAAGGTVFCGDIVWVLETRFGGDDGDFARGGEEVPAFGGLGLQDVDVAGEDARVGGGGFDEGRETEED